MKIAIYAIAKNEEQFIKRFCDSAKDADLILIADTGSTDDTVGIAKSCGASVHSIDIKPWRFDKARNAALDLLPDDIDICVSVDVDEVMEPGWREEMERAWTPETTRLRYFFDWGQGIKFKAEKAHTRRGYHWRHPVHENLTPDDPAKEVYGEVEAFLVTHHPDPTKSRGQYLDLLKMSVEEDPSCPRNAFYYARELSFYGRWAEAIEACERYLKMPNAYWHHERCYALRIIAQSHGGLGNRWLQEKALLQACAEGVDNREPWCELATLYYEQGRWAQCYASATRALSIEVREWVYTADPRVWGHWAHDLASISAWHLNLKDIALEQAALAVDKSPDDARLRANLKFLQDDAPVLAREAILV